MMTDDIDFKPWMETVSGARFEFLAPKSDQIVIEDIATALSRTARYGGHSKRVYYVAEHCVLMAEWVLAQSWGDPRMALTALHHDDAEAYIGDLPRPAKQQVPQFKDLELGIDEAIARKFNTEWPFPAWLKTCDTAILVDERAQVMNLSRNKWDMDHIEPLGVRTWNIMGRFQWYVRRRWLKTHHKLVAMCYDQGYFIDH